MDETSTNKSFSALLGAFITRLGLITRNSISIETECACNVIGIWFFSNNVKGTMFWDNFPTVYPYVSILRGIAVTTECVK